MPLKTLYFVSYIFLYTANGVWDAFIDLFCATKEIKFVPLKKLNSRFLFISPK